MGVAGKCNFGMAMKWYEPLFSELMVFSDNSVSTILGKENINAI